MRVASAVSIVMPVFNGGSLLQVSVESALAQTFDDFELILVDDGSTDDCIESVRGLDPRISITAQDNQGASAAAQAGMSGARGEFVAFLDQDDLWSPGKLAAQVAAMRSDPSLALTFSATAYIGPEGEALPLPPKHWDGPIAFEDLMRDFVIGNTSSVMVRRQDALDAGGFDPRFRYMYDLDLFLRIALLEGKTLTGSSSQLTYYRRHPSQMSRKWLDMESEWERLLDKIRPLGHAAFARCEAEARVNMCRYFAYLCCETGAPGRGFSFLASAARREPKRFIADRRNWLMAAACTVSSLLPTGMVQHLAALVPKRLSTPQARLNDPRVQRL